MPRRYRPSPLDYWGRPPGTSPERWRAIVDSMAPQIGQQRARENREALRYKAYQALAALVLLMLMMAMFIEPRT